MRPNQESVFLKAFNFTCSLLGSIYLQNREQFKSKGDNRFLSLGSSDHTEYHIPDYEKKAHKLEYAEGIENGEER